LRHVSLDEHRIDKLLNLPMGETWHSIKKWSKRLNAY
jgi:hypothetical protein